MATKAARPIGGWTDKGLPPPLDKTILFCSAPVRDELMGSLDLYAEIKDSGKELLRAHGHKDLKGSFARFQAYIRQAKTFYEGAEILHHRASPLNFYYSFLNLAKALILLRDPNFVDRNLTHGIIQKPAAGSLRKQKIIIQPHGVFPNFYRLVTGHRLLNNATLRITDLLGYSSDVQFEYENSDMGLSHFFAPS